MTNSKVRPETDGETIAKATGTQFGGDAVGAIMDKCVPPSHSLMPPNA